ncbi:hypothetical protein GCM10009119_10920 [Algoriphagus jejuensis]|uniref:Uncharacterized protein n=1 Tax=Algoriphagus jejuensis TaxID=419934 RepID=A0ABN1MYE6_9BACT
MQPPFSTHYFYYLLAIRLEETITIMFGDSYPYLLKSSFQKIPTKPSLLIQHDTKKVDMTLVRDLKDLLLAFIGEVGLKPRPELESWSLERNKAWLKARAYEGGQKLEIKDEHLQAFWYKARICDKNRAGKTNKFDINPQLMDLLAFFCGYDDFRDFIQREFGKDYVMANDQVLVSLYEKYRFSIDDIPSEELVTDSEIASPEPDASPVSSYSASSQKGKKPNARWKFVPFIFLALAGTASTFYFFGRVGQAEVRITLTTDYLHFETDGAVDIRSSEGNVFSSTDHFYIRNGLYSLHYPFSNSLPASLKIASIESQPVGIAYLKLPAQTGITIEAPTKHDIYFDLLEPRGLEGNLRLKNLVAFSSAEDSSVTYGDTPIGTGINFQSAPNENLQLSLIQAGDFELPPILVSSVAFGKLGQQKVEYGILSGQIELPEYGENFVLNSRDMLTLSLQDPSKLIISYREGVLSVTFSGSVNSLQTGIDAAKPNGGKNLLPKRIESWASFPNSLIAGLLFTALIVAYQMKKSR